MASRRQYRQALAGLLAGLSGAGTVVVGLMLLLFIGISWQLMQDTASGVTGDQIWQARAQDISRLPGFLWGWRWGLLVLACVGLPLALVDILTMRIDQPWRGHLGLVALLGLAGAVVVTVQYLDRENSIARLVEHPDQLADIQSALVPDWALLLLGAPIALLISGGVWALWSWWYARWSRWLRRDGLPGGTWQPPAPAGASLPLRHSPLRRFVLALIGVTIAVIGSVQIYHIARTQVSGGQLWVAPDSPRDTKQLSFTRPSRRLALANSFGDGSVLIALVHAQDKTPVGSEQVMPLAGTPPREQVTELAVGSLPRGDYALTALLREGSGGKLSYALFQGTGTWIQLVASLVGLSAGIWLSLVALIVLEALARWVWLDDPRDGAMP